MVAAFVPDVLGYGNGYRDRDDVSLRLPYLLRQGSFAMMINRYRVFVGLLLFAAPLSAQTSVQVPVPDRTIVVQTEPAQVDVDVTVQVNTDSLAVAFERANASLADRIAQLPQQQAERSTFERLARDGAWLVLGIIGVRQLYNIANRGPDVHNDGDVTVNVPPHENDDHHHGHGHGKH